MNVNIFKKIGKIAIAGAVAGLGMLAGDRIADDKPAFGLFNKKDDDTDDKTTETEEKTTEESTEKTDEDTTQEDEG